METQGLKVIQKDGVFLTYTPYNKSFAEAMRKTGKWDKEMRCWVTPKEYGQELKSNLLKFFPDGEIDFMSEKAEPGTLLNKVRKILENRNALYEGDTLERIVAFSYHLGREDATKEVGDAYYRMIKDMRKRAEKSRYTALINEAIGKKNYIPFDDYEGKVGKEIGGLKTDILK